MRALLALALVLTACAHQRDAVTREAEDESGVGFGGSFRWARRNLAAWTLAQADAQGVDSTITVPITFTQPFTATSATFTGGLTALSFTSTQASGSNGFIAPTGVRWKIGGGSTDYFSSAGGTTITAAGDFAVAGTLTFTDARPTGTGIMDLNSHVPDGTTAFTFDASSNLTSGLHSSWRENGTTALMTLDHAGALAPISISTNGTATFGGVLTAQVSAVLGSASDNELTVAGAATGSPPTITASGVDTNVDVNLVPKGSGSLEVASREVPVLGNTATGPIMICYGEKAVSSGVVTITFSSESCGEAFGGTPSCLCGNTSNTTENTCSTTGESTTQVTLNGTTSDTYTWFCFGARP